MLELLIVVLILLWLFGYFGAGRTIPNTGNLVHVLLVVILVLIVVRLIFGAI